MGRDQQSENNFAVDVTRCSQPGKVSSSNEVTDLKVVSIRMSNRLMPISILFSPAV